MRVTISLPFQLTLKNEDGSLTAKLHLEWPRKVIEADVNDSWKYYFNRGVRIHVNGNESIILKPFELTLSFSLLREDEDYVCEHLEEFLEEKVSEVKCSKGLVIRRGNWHNTKSAFIKTRIDVLGPRIRAKRSTSRRALR